MTKTPDHARRFALSQNTRRKRSSQTSRVITGMGLLSLQLFSAASSFAAIDATCWDAASEFNDSANPDAANSSGVWSYGWKKTLSDTFFLDTTPFTDPPARFGWCNASGFPLICH